MPLALIKQLLCARDGDTDTTPGRTPEGDMSVPDTRSRCRAAPPLCARAAGGPDRAGAHVFILR